MSDYRNLSVPFADLGLDMLNPRDKISIGKWYTLSNAYPQSANVISQRKGFSAFFDVGINAGDVTQLFPVTPERTFYVLNVAGGTIAINDPISGTGYDPSALSIGWGNFPTFVSAQVPYSVGFSPYTILGPVPAPAPWTETVQYWVFASSSEKLQKFAYPPIFGSGSAFGVSSWGLPPPTDTPTVFLPGSAGGQDSSVSGAEPYTYKYTRYSTITGAESAPSPASAEIDSTLQAIQVNFVGGSVDILQDALRIYRKGGTQVSTYRLVGTVGSSFSSFTDSAADDTISTAVALNEDSFQPFITKNFSGEILYGTALPYIWGPFLGQYILACGDEVSPGSVFWTNPGTPESMSPDNNLIITSANEPLMNGFLYGANTFAFSQQRLFALDYGGPSSIPTFVAREIPIGMGLAAPFALAVSSLGGAFFLGNDGIYVTDCQSQIQSITNDSLRPIFRGESTGQFAPVEYLDTDGNPSRDIRLFASGQELHFVYPDTDGRMQHLVYNILQKSWRSFELGDSVKKILCGASIGGSESAFLVGTTDDGTFDQHTRLLKYNNNDVDSPDTDFGVSFPIFISTGGYDMEIPQTLKEYGNIIIDADTDGQTVTVTPIYNGNTFGTTQSFSGTGRQRYPISLDDTYAYFVNFNFDWNSLGGSGVKLYNIEILFRADQEILKHWEVPETTFGLPGWNHLRDAYFMMRTTAPVTVTQTIDGVVHTYTLPSTSGEKRKLYLKFDPVKGKVFRFALDSSGGFRLYGDETQLNIKPWNTALGYKPIFPFTAPGYAPFLRNEAGT